MNNECTVADRAQRAIGNNCRTRLVVAIERRSIFRTEFEREKEFLISVLDKVFASSFESGV